MKSVRAYAVLWSVALALAMPQPAHASPKGDDRVPEGVSASDWSSICAAYEAGRHAISESDGNFRALNPGQQWRTRFDGRGFETTPGASGWSWGLELVRYGWPDAERTVTAPAYVEADGSRIRYEWDETLTEWYINDPRGLEHGYTVQRRPTGFQGEALLHLTLAVRGGLSPQVSNDGRGVTFVNTAGAAVVNYGGLKVIDANGAEVPAWFEAICPAQASSLKSQTFSIVVDDSNAVYPITIDPIAQQAYLKASNPDALDNFSIVAASGDTIAISSYGEDSNATGVNGNQTDNSASASGAVYVFVRDINGVWSQQAYLKASNTGANDNFGTSVALSGNTLVAGANNEDSSATGVNGNQADNSATDSGAAYVFVRNGTTWSQEAYLKASNTGSADSFGWSVAISDDTVVVGAYGEDSNATGVNGNQADNTVQVSGAAYVFVRSGGVWSQQAYLKASNTRVGAWFGYALGLSGDTLVVSSPTESSNATGVNGNQSDSSVPEAGAAYVFIRSGITWSQQAYLKSSNTELQDWFGEAIAISGDTVVVAANREDSSTTGVNGNQADNSAANAGAAYVFIRNGTAWSQQAYLKASNTGVGDRFGWSVAAESDTILVGAISEASCVPGVNNEPQSNDTAPAAGAVYVFVRIGSIWTHKAYLKASNPERGDQFGGSVALSGDTFVVGANGEDSSASGINGDQTINGASGNFGAAYLFTRTVDTIADADGDGVPDANDVCPATAPGVPVDCTGRPLNDCNSDCHFDGADVQCIVNGLLGQ